MLRVSKEKNVAFDTCGLTSSRIQAKGEKFKATQVAIITHEKSKEMRQWLEELILNW